MRAFRRTLGGRPSAAACPRPKDKWREWRGGEPLAPLPQRGAPGFCARPGAENSGKLRKCEGSECSTGVASEAGRACGSGIRPDCLGADFPVKRKCNKGVKWDKYKRRMNRIPRGNVKRSFFEKERR